MSFADQLKGFVNQKREREAADAAERTMQVKKGWSTVVELFYRDLKGWCVKRAQSGESDLTFAFFNFIRTFDSQHRLLDASGNSYSLTQEEEMLLWDVRRSLCYDDRLSASYAQDLGRQITARFQSEGLEAQATPLENNAAFPDVKFYIQW